MKKFAGVMTALAAVLLWAAPAHAALADVETPTVTGPVPVTATSTPWAATDKPLASYGYVEEEFEYAGDAFTYDFDPSSPVDQTATKVTTGGPADDGRYPYRTRMIVRRPANPADFNGTVVVEWQNVTATFDLEANWYGDPEYLLENGYAYVAVSAQRAGVNSLRGWDAPRYGDLDVSWRDGGGAERICAPPSGSPPPGCTVPSDALSYDIYAAALKSLLDGGAGADPLGPLPLPETVIASGESQSAGRLNNYYNRIQPIHELVDAFLLTVSGGTTPIRDDRSEPTMRVLSETENRTPRTAPDAPNYRQWEVAGGSHLPRMAFDNFQGPIERDLGITLGAACEKYPLSQVQWPFVVNSAYEHLIRWANGGAAPPIAPRGQYDPGADPSDQLVRDELGLAQGGIRLPEMAVPVRLNTGINSIGTGGGVFSAFCGLLGSSEDLSDSAILAQYPDWANYVGQVGKQAQNLVDAGFLLEGDLPRLIAMHEAVPNVRPTHPRRTGGKKKNRGQFTLDWQGTTNELGTFELEHSEDGGETWSPVAKAGALPDPGFEFTGKGEKDGEWIYRVRSNTTIPADAVREEFVITTPWSETSGGPTTVDKTGPKIKLKCPKRAKVGKRAFVRIDASDKGVGLRKDPSGRKKINTRRKGKQKITVKATDKLGNKTAEKCTVKVRP
jgi:hypothetical protein